MGVTPFYKWFEHDGVRGPNIATVYSDRGHGVRAAGRLLQPRRTRPAALLKPGDFDWKPIFARGVRWFHSGGIFAALSETTGELIIEGMKAAKARRRDHLVRPELPRQALGLGRRRREGAVEVIAQDRRRTSTCLVGNEEDLQKGLGVAGPGRRQGRVEARPRRVLRHDRARVVEGVPEHQAGGDDAARGPLDQPPRLGGRALARRQAGTSARRASSTCIDRIGGGDGFAVRPDLRPAHRRDARGERSASAGPTARC